MKTINTTGSNQKLWNYSDSRQCVIWWLKAEQNFMYCRNEYARKYIQYNLPILINNTLFEIIENIYTPSLHSFARYIKLKRVTLFKLFLHFQ